MYTQSLFPFVRVQRKWCHKMSFIKTFVACAAILFCILSRVSCNTCTEERNILRDLLDNYGEPYIPTADSSPTRNKTQVQVNMMINSVSNLDEFKMKYSVQLTLRNEWHDERLNVSSQQSDYLRHVHDCKYCTLGEAEIKRIWIPDMFFINEKESHFHNVIQPNLFLRIHPDGSVEFSRRISLTLDCPMDLRRFPMDSQHCEILMASYAWTEDDLVLKWRERDPLQMMQNLTLPRFFLEGQTTSTCERITATGSYSCIKVVFKLVRNFSFYLVQLYFPCAMLVIVSWISFWLDEGAVSARIALGVTTLLTMATTQANMNKNLPPVSYMKAMDIYSGACLAFIFGALLEFALVNHATRRRTVFDKEPSLPKPVQDRRGHHHHHHQSLPVCINWSWREGSGPSGSIDGTARVLFPVTFLLFNVLYWLHYLA